MNVNSSRIYKRRRHVVLAAILFVDVVILLAASIHIIPTGYTGVKTSFGQIQEEPVRSGSVSFSIPFVEEVHKVNNKQQDHLVEEPIWGEASDKTPVYAADVTVTYQILPDRSVWLYAHIADMKHLVGDDLVASAVKSAMVGLMPEDVTNRGKIEPLVREKLQALLDGKYGGDAVYVNQVVIGDMDFEEAYNAAIQQKSIAQQNAEKQRIKNEAAIAKAEAEKQVAVTNAEAEAEKLLIEAWARAEANREIEESLSDTLIEYQKVEKWDGKLPTVTGGNSIVGIDTEE